jgi:hypothetical protein
MGILDEAIREHLELKRQHGADQTELQKLEDEAFGAPGRPGDEGADALAEAPTEFMAQPEAAAEGEQAEVADAPPGRSESRIADLQEAPEAPPAEEAEEEEADEEPSATEHEIVSEPAPAGPTTEEREVIAEQPTEMHDVEEELAEEQGEDEVDVVDLEEDEEDDDFWDEKRLSDELDQALEAPPLDSEEEGELADEAEIEEPAEEPELEEPEAEAPAAGGEDEDVLEETPEFLEQSPEDDELWFEQKPPKDFDFDD